MDTSIAADWHKEFNCGWIGAGPKSATTNKEVRDTSVEIRNDQKDIRASRENLGCVYGRLTGKHRGDSNKRPVRDIARPTMSSNANIDLREFKSLLDPGAFPHPVENIELIETHISWVILTGPYAYKIKKPVKLAFLDFRDLHRRRFYCEEEIRLNQAWTPEIYLDVVTINRDQNRLRIGGTGEIVEYAVRMRQFEQGATLDSQLAAGALTTADMHEVAAIIAKHHQQAAVCRPGIKNRILTLTKKFMLDNFEPLDDLIQENKLWPLRGWTAAELNKLEMKLRQRYDDGFVRDCHGDLHLANLVRLPFGIAAFDRIEFDAKIREIDVINDVAFLVMDLFGKDRPDLGFLVLNRYLELTGDYDSVSVFQLYFVYRCLVRAKVMAIHCHECHDSDDAEKHMAELHRYLDLAGAQTVKRTPVLIVMHGFSGSGKTWLSGQLMGELPAVRVRSDIERKRIHGLAETAASVSGVGQGLYTDSANEDVYTTLCLIAESVLRAGHDVILDASFLRIRQRERARQTAVDCGAGFLLIETKASNETLRDRLLQRVKFRDDVSEAGMTVLDYQQKSAEPLTISERQLTFSVCTSDENGLASVLQRIRHVAVIDDRRVRSTQ